MEALLSNRNRTLLRELVSRSFRSADEAAEEICRLVQTVLGVPLAFASVIDGEAVRMLAVADHLGSGLVAGSRLPLHETFCERALNGTGPQSSDDLLDSPYADLPVLRRLGVRSYAMSPLWNADGRSTGTLSVLERRSRLFGEEELGLLEVLGGILSRERELDRVRALEEWRASAHQASESRFLDLLDDLGDLVVEVDAQGGITYANRAFTDMAGVPLDQMSQWGMFDRVHPDDRALAERHIGTAVSGAVTGGDVPAHELRFLVPGGGERWMSVRGRAVLDESGSLAGFRGIMHDVSVRVEAEQQVRAALAQAEQALTEAQRAQDQAERASRAKSEFLSRMSHELRTPLNAILGFGQLLEFAELAGEDAENVEQILRAGRHLLDLINEVLDVVRVESGALSLSLEPVEVGDVLAESVDLVRTAAAARQITVRTPDRLNGARVVADRQRLKQVLVNLLSNAVKYNRDGGSIEVRWAASPADAERLRLTVADTGRGIPADRLDAVFTPFDRLGAENTEIEGTGVGLSLTRTLVEAQDGTIGVMSEVAQGSTFWVELPAAEPVAVPAAEPTPEAELTRTVLYVEDNPANITLVRRVLARRPHLRVEVVQDGAEAVEATHRLVPDLVLLDLHLPGLSGSGVLAALRGADDARLRKMPVVVVTADLTTGNERRMLEAGATLFLPKPIDVHQLLAVVDDLLPRT